MEPLETLQSSLSAAQNELESAELALLEATARAEDARTACQRLGAAVAALSGEPPPAAESREDPSENTPIPENIPPSDPERANLRDMTPEEFDRHRRLQQRKREKEALENNPYAHIKCSGCGSKGTMSETVMQAPSGAPIRMMVCGSCGNQAFT